MTFSAAYASLCRTDPRHGIVKPPSVQADYDAALRAAQNPHDRAVRLAREARFAGMRERSLEGRNVA
jgi:hypothetical protein